MYFFNCALLTKNSYFPYIYLLLWFCNGNKKGLCKFNSKLKIKFPRNKFTKHLTIELYISSNIFVNNREKVNPPNEDGKFFVIYKKRY